MKVLWLVSSILPQAAQACGLPGDTVSGGWLTGQLNALRPVSELHLQVLCVTGQKSLTGTQDGVTYSLLPKDTDLSSFLAAAKPDLVHIWGTEYPAAAAMQRAAAALHIPALINMQGVMRRIADHLCDGLPASVQHSPKLWHWVDKLIPGELVDDMQAWFYRLADAETSVLVRAKYVTGRTDFDWLAVNEVNHNARYYPCNETLRPCFYTGTLWQPRAAAAPILFLPQGNYPIKNLHTLIQALPAVLQVYPCARLHIAGWAPLDKGPLLRPVTDGLFPYKAYCRKLAQRLGVAEHIRYLGPLDAESMRQAYLDADVFVLPSTCENSPNSLGEAMLLGLPCVVSHAGGIPDMLTHEREGLIYGNATDAGALANHILQVLQSPDGGAALGQAARARALQTHDPRTNALTLWKIYADILARQP